MADKPVILVVDDAPVNIQVLAACLKENYQLKIATNGARCLELATCAPVPDLILLDIEMPDMGGYEVCQHLKQHNDTKNIPIIFVTARDADQDEEYGLHLGAVDYITKPIRPAIVQARVRTQITLKQQRDMLQNLALHDQLTDLYNRHYLMEAAEQKIAESKRYLFPLSLLMIDVDHFKQVNDQHGHTTGDSVLKAIAKILQEQSRKDDIAARIGGEEFVLLLGRCSLPSALQRAEQLRQAIEAAQPEGLTVTVSIGVAELSEGQSFDSMLSLADNRLYQAKAQGRNRVIAT
ncbi:GGDEF domain-containing response regulator [Oceanospirillum beijerinckii]|uniref:GGDEF domain-containing response regulator n=1 Tax=Oceanospirillum beijerinckii TaxID=64976 RepID=UPI00042466E1|nr:diguanylate cyclase [Oceanospirillum beijerinckii]MAC46575.1 diguanylate cyclase response regulator [Oceanospirillum sp.]